MLKYKLYKDTRSNSQFKGCWYARIAKSDIITTRQLVAHMAKHGTAYSKGTMWAVITDMITCVHELILRGQAVKIDDLAIFSIGIVSKPDPTAKEEGLLTTLESVYEFYLRGFHFDTIDIYRSDASKFLITENGLLPPLISVHGLGEAAAVDTVEKRKGKKFISVEEFSACCNKLSKTHIEQLKALGAFAGMADTSQVSLFETNHFHFSHLRMRTLRNE